MLQKSSIHSSRVPPNHLSANKKYINAYKKFRRTLERDCPGQKKKEKKPRSPSTDDELSTRAINA